MNTLNGYAICTDCKYSSLNYCNKFNEECLSISIAEKRHQLNCLACINTDSYTSGKFIKEELNNIGYFHVPNPYFLKLYAISTYCQNKHPDAFYSNRKIYEIYGNFGGEIWNGRTPDYGMRCLNNQQILNIKKLIEQLNLKMNLTFNNHLIKEKDLYDSMSNMVAEVFHDGTHNITLSSDYLYQYLKKTYPNYHFYYSAIASENSNLLDDMSLFNKYNMLLWPRNENNNFKLLEQVPELQKLQIEFLCNDNCTPFCNRKIHYNLVNQEIKERKANSEFQFLKQYCTIDHDFVFYNTKRWPITINSEDIDKYISMGFQHFKLCSRNDPLPVFAYKLYKYLVKPEFFEDIYFLTLDLLKSSFLNEFEV